ncbi:MAG: hypothetical protein KC800_12055, partial [Candidatus Eremiobacteraeota bacterium]|nr:hypothetical protein [Candidatus Eremiobacteraeota bacterium]
MQIQFYDALNQRVVSTPYAELSQEEVRKLEAAGQVRGQSDAIFEQEVTYFGFTTDRRLIQDDPSGYQVGFCSRSLDDPIFGPIKDSNIGGGFEDPPVNITVTLPPQEEGEDKGTLLKLGDSEFIPIEGNTISITYTGDINNSLIVNGQSIENWWQTTGNGPGWAWTPVIRATTPGVYRVSSDYLYATGEATFLLRRLEFEEEFPEFPSEPTGPIEIQNSFAWSDGAAVETPRWSVEEKDGDTAVQGEGTEILATWKPDERTFAAQTTDDLKYEDVPVEVLARADSYLHFGQRVPYEISSEFDVPGAEQFQIVNERITTENPFEEPGEPVEVQADVITIGLDDIVEDDIEWFVSIKDPEGNVIPELKHFATGFGPEIVAEWDGTVDGTLVEEPLAHSFFLEARYCEDGGGVVVVLRASDEVRSQDTIPEDECGYVAEADVPISGEEGIIEIYDDATEELLATSEAEPYTGGSDPIASLVALAPTINLSRSNDDIILKRRGQPTKIQIRYIVDSKDAGTKQSIKLKVETSFSNPAGFEVELPRLSESGTKVQFRDIFTLVDGSSGGKNIGIQAPNNSFSTFDYNSNELRSGADPEIGYPDGNAQDGFEWRNGESGTELGFAAHLTAAEKLSNGYRAEKIPPTEVALKAGGFEDLIVSRQNRKAWTRVKNQARRLYISDHGYASGAIFADGKSVSPVEIGQEWKDSLELVIVAGCSVLNIGNFNGWAGYDESPGRSWKGATKPGSVMLGYNATAPAADPREPAGSLYADTRILQRYRQQLPTQAGQYSDPGEAQAMAWLVANASMEVRLADNACAITDQYYYFIRVLSHSIDGDRVTDPHYQNDYGAISTQRGIWRLHRDHWEKLGPTAFESLPKGQRGRTLMRDLPDAGSGEA